MWRLDETYIVLSIVAMLGVGHQRKSENSDVFDDLHSALEGIYHARHCQTGYRVHIMHIIYYVVPLLIWHGDRSSWSFIARITKQS